MLNPIAAFHNGARNILRPLNLFLRPIDEQMC